jgi:hypothetical protein
MEHVMRIVVISEEIAVRPAEGLLVFLMHMCSYLAGRHDLLVLHGGVKASYRRSDADTPDRKASQGVISLVSPRTGTLTVDGDEEVP